MIKIHIKRKVPPEKVQGLRVLINQLRALTMGQPGYIAGETLKRVDKPGESLIIAKWQSIDFWQWQRPGNSPAVLLFIDACPMQTGVCPPRCAFWPFVGLGHKCARRPQWSYAGGRA